MGYLKFSPDLFLESQELNRLKYFLDTFGFRYFFRKSALSYGLIDQNHFELNALTNQYLFDSFLSLPNGLVSQSLTVNSIDVNPLLAISSAGEFIFQEKKQTISIPNNNTWYWVKIAFAYTTIERGSWSIDINGNITEPNLGGDLTTILRGQPNFPSRIKFKNSLNNILEYDVVSVIDSNNAILAGTSFIAESNLQLVVVGTFSPGSVPTSSEKEIFQYDYCNITLTQEITLNTPTFKIQDSEFFLARVKNNGGVISVQDKRTEFYRFRGDFENKFRIFIENPLFGIEKIKYNRKFSDLQKNIVYLSWSFRSNSYLINSNANIITLNAGQGGKYKTVADVNDDDFTGWRLYVSDGSYLEIKDCVVNGSQVDLYFDIFNIDKFSNDGGITFTNEDINITPPCEEIEIIASSVFDESISSGNENEITNEKFVFPINEITPFIHLFVINDNCQYDIKYRYKNYNEYSEEFNLNDDASFGYYNESAFDSNGEFLPIVLASSYSVNVSNGYINVYSNSLITLKINNDALNHDWITHTLTNSDLDVIASGVNFYLQTAPGQPNNEKYIKYKIIGKTCFLQFLLLNSNVSATPFSGVQIKLPNNILAKSEFGGSGTFRNTFTPLTDSPSNNTASPGEVAEDHTVVRVGTSSFISQYGDSIIITPGRGQFNNFAGGGTDNLNWQGSIFFEIEQ